MTTMIIHTLTMDFSLSIVHVLRVKCLEYKICKQAASCYKILHQNVHSLVHVLLIRIRLPPQW